MRADYKMSTIAGYNVRNCPFPARTLLGCVRRGEDVRIFSTFWLGDEFELLHTPAGITVRLVARRLGEVNTRQLTETKKFWVSVLATASRSNAIDWWVGIVKYLK